MCTQPKHEPRCPAAHHILIVDSRNEGGAPQMGEGTPGESKARLLLPRVYHYAWRRETGRQRDRQRGKETETQKEQERGRITERGRERQAERQADTDRQTERLGPPFIGWDGNQDAFAPTAFPPVYLFRSPRLSFRSSHQHLNQEPNPTTRRPRTSCATCGRIDRTGSPLTRRGS